VHWLRAVLKYKLPPARTLELGAAHGGFVALMGLAGYDASGLELSPWIADFARKTFGVRMYQGPVERQPIEPGSLDVLALMDVAEHLPDPVGTLAHGLSLLKPEGVMVVQTPALPEGKTFAQMRDDGDPFANHLLADEHLYLFSRTAARELMSGIGCADVRFEPAIFAHYDQFVVASRAPLVEHTPEQIRAALESTPGGRLAGALLDAAEQRDYFARECEARLKVIHVLDAEVKRLQAPSGETKTT
jgi:SAM-dependent methyltransferase